MLWVKKILKKDWEFLLGLIVLATIIYATSWFNEFVSDDIAGIQYNPALGNVWQQITTLNINNILYSLIYAIFGPQPFWFHVLNTTFHIITVIVVYVLTLFFVKSQKPNNNDFKNPTFGRWIPRLTALLFAIHPIETEGVTWVSGLSYASYTLLFLLALLFFALTPPMDNIKTVDYKKLIISTLFFILSLSASEKAIIFPLILTVYIFLFVKPIIKNLALTTPSFVIATLYTLSRFVDVGKRIEYVSPNYAGGITIFNPFIQIPIAIYSYLKLLLFPINLTLYHEFSAFPRWEYYLAITVTLFIFGTVVIFWWLGRKSNFIFHKLVAFGLLLFIISLAPTLLPINIAWIVAERYVHLGSIGFFLAISALLYQAIIRFKIEKAVVVTVVSTVAILLTIAGITRNRQWRSQDTLWPATVKASPYSAYAHNNMGDYYGRHQDIKASIREFEIARKLRPRYAEATHNLGNAYLTINEATYAAKLFKEALEYNPALYQSHQNLGRIALAQKNYQEAENQFLSSIKINPNPFTDYLHLYIIYQQTTQKQKAEEALIAARRLADNKLDKLQLLQQVLVEFEEPKQ